ALLPLALSACVTTTQTNPATGKPMVTQPPKSASSGIAYVCDDGTALSARFSLDTAYITPAGGKQLALPRATSASGIKYATPTRLSCDPASIPPGGGKQLAHPRATSASGIKYETPTHTCWGKGPQATWTVGKKAPTTCRTNQM